MVPHAQVVAEQVIAQWVLEAHRSTVATDMRREDVIRSAEVAEAGSEASVVSTPTKPNIVPTKTELPSSSSIVPSADAAGGP